MKEKRRQNKGSEREGKGKKTRDEEERATRLVKGKERKGSETEERERWDGTEH